MASLRFLICFFAFAVVVNECTHPLQNPMQLDCMDTLDSSNFEHLDAVCQECYDLFREPDILAHCRSNCFKNSYFSKCANALLLAGEQEEVDRALSGISDL